MGLEIKLGYEHKEEVLELFKEYIQMLVENEPSMEIYLSIQNYDEEIKDLEKKYGQPEGRLYLAYLDGKLAGCIALRKLDNENCEMKRLFVRPELRGKKIANSLIEKIIEDAKGIGYKSMFLDTLPFLKSAIHLYKKLGFEEIKPYNDSPVDTTIFMKIDL